MDRKLRLYWSWVRAEAKKIKADGCSGVPDFRLDCCLEHDLGYYYGKSVRSAYKKYLKGSPTPWEDASETSRWDIDKIFWSCNCQKSFLGKWSPMGLWRLVAVRVLGWRPWIGHRKER